MAKVKLKVSPGKNVTGQAVIVVRLMGSDDEEIISATGPHNQSDRTGHDAFTRSDCATRISSLVGHRSAVSDDFFFLL